MLSEPTWRTSLVRHLESDPPRFVNPQRVMPSEIWYKNRCVSENNTRTMTPLLSALNSEPQSVRIEHRLIGRDGFADAIQLRACRLVGIPRRRQAAEFQQTGHQQEPGLVR